LAFCVTLAALAALAAYDNLQLDPGVAEAVHDRLGIGVPFHVQLVHQAIAEDARQRRSERVTPADVGRVWTERVLARPTADLPHWEQRLRKALAPPEYERAVRVDHYGPLHRR
jgi:hypothetical protein